MTRMAYGRRGAANLYPADAVLNLPPVKQSLGLARVGGGRGAARVLRSGGRGDHARHRRADRQAPAGATRGRRRSRCERVLRRAPARAQRQRCRAGDDLRRERRGHAPRGVARGHRRGGCGQPAEAGHPAVPGGKNGRKRMAELGCVDDRVPVPRTAADIIARSGKDPAWARPPRAARPHGGRQVADRIGRRGHQHRRRGRVRRGTAPRPRAPAYLDRPRGRQQDPDRGHRGRSRPPRRPGDHFDRLHSRP